MLVSITLFLLVGCATPSPPIEPALQAATAIPTLDRSSSTTLCNTIITSQGQDWELVIEALQTLDSQSASCRGLNTSEALYEAYVGYGEHLEMRGRIQEAQNAYLSALNYTETDTRARDALSRFDRVNTVSSQLLTCDDETLSEASNLPDYTPSDGVFVTVNDGLLTADEQPFLVRGVIYEPRDYPGERFLAETPEEAVNEELFLIASSGLNTIRVYLYYNVLFQCPGDGAVPVPSTFTRLDQVIRAAAARNLRVIMVLNQDPTPNLYNSPPHTTAQMMFLIERYADEPTVLAWDVRDGGDLDYTRGDIARDTVLSWLSATTQAVRQNAPNHLVTAGWQGDAAATAPFVDFVSFQHYGNLDDLRQEIALLESQTEKPLFLASVGYPMTNGDELTQQDNIYDALLAAENNALLGWAVYKAFDHPRTVCEDCEQFGLWYTNYSPKLALNAIDTVIGE